MSYKTAALKKQKHMNRLKRAALATLDRPQRFCVIANCLGVSLLVGASVGWYAAMRHVKKNAERAFDSLARLTPSAGKLNSTAGNTDAQLLTQELLRPVTGFKRVWNHVDDESQWV